MLKLVQLELKKFKNHTAIRLFGLMFLITLPTVIFVAKRIQIPENPVFKIDSIYQFPNVWDYMGYTTSWLTFFFLGFITLTTITSEVSYKTMRQNIITGVTRNSYFLSKVLNIILISIIVTILFTVISFAIGAFHTESYTIATAFTNNYAIPRCFLMCMGYMSFALMIGFVIRRSGVAIFLYVCYIIFIESMLKWSSLKFVESGIINYWPLNTIEDLFPNPIYYMKDYIPTQTDFEFLLSSQNAMVFSTLWIGVFLGIGYFSFLKRDI